MQKIKRKVKFIIIVLFLSGCTITRYENYKFFGYGAKSVEKHDKTHAYIPISNSIYEYKKTGILRDRKIRKEPYFYYFSICGNFNEIKSLEAHFIQNKTKKIEVPISMQHIKTRKPSKYSLCNLEYIFSYGKKMQLPITWDETDKLEVEVNFIGVENGIKKKYKLRGKYKKDAIIENTNLKWDAIMGI
jgi:hypothetical protein